MIQYRNTIDNTNFQVIKYEPEAEKVMVAGMVKDIDIKLDGIKVGGFKAMTVLHHRQIPLSKEQKRAARYFRRKNNKGQENMIYARVIAQHQKMNL